MSILPGEATKFPGDKDIDIFPNPELERNDFSEDPLGYDPTPRIPTYQLALNEFPIKESDFLLANNLMILGKIKHRKLNSDIRVVTSDVPLIQTFLSQIRLFPANYQGNNSLTSDYSCQIVAAKLGDRFDTTQRRFTRRSFVENDYFGIIAYEVSNNRTLIAFERSWVLPALAKYIDEKITYEMERPVSLRERMATKRPIWAESGEPYAQWDNIPELQGEEFKLSDLTIYPIHDDAFTCGNGCPSEAYMIFAPVSQDEAEKIYLFLNRNAQLYTDVAQLTIADVPLPKAKDFQYLFPIDLSFIGNYVVISTDQLTRDQLEHAWEFNELSTQFPRLNNLTGIYATYLLSESMFFQYSMRWENNTLFTGLCGYIQNLDLIENYGRIINEIERENPFYKELPNFATAINLVKTTDVKCFFYNGKYYAALYTNIDIITINETLILDYDPTRIEMICPLMAITRRNAMEDARKYLRDFGYDISPNPDTYQNNIQLGFRTYQLGEVVFTQYYYNSTNAREIDLHEIDGSHNQEVMTRLQFLLQKGYFFTLKVLNITKGYPDFIPSDPPINRNLSKNPSTLITELDNLIRGLNH